MPPRRSGQAARSTLPCVRGYCPGRSSRWGAAQPRPAGSPTCTPPLPAAWPGRHPFLPILPGVQLEPRLDPPAGGDPSRSSGSPAPLHTRRWAPPTAGPWPWGLPVPLAWCRRLPCRTTFTFLPPSHRCAHRLHLGVLLICSIDCLLRGTVRPAGQGHWPFGSFPAPVTGAEQTISARRGGTRASTLWAGRIARARGPEPRAEQVCEPQRARGGPASEGRDKVPGRRLPLDGDRPEQDWPAGCAPRLGWAPQWVPGGPL